MKTPPILLRYPGGKSRKIAALLPPLLEDIKKTNSFCEPFVGGGAMALTVAAEFPGLWLYLNDLDPHVFAFWDLVVNGSSAEVASFFRLLRRGASLPRFDHERARTTRPNLSRVVKAYHAVFFSKTTHNGIFHASPIGGRHQRGKRWKIDCQFKPDNMERTFWKIRELLSKCHVSVTRESAEMWLPCFTGRAPVYLDPPYYHAGKLCYPTWMTNAEHARLAALLRRRKNWLLSYDDCEEIRALYKWANVKTLEFRYSMASHGGERSWKQKTELLIQPWR